MKTISLKIDDDIFEDTEKILTKVKKSRNRYINDALDYYNKLQRRAVLEKKLEAESKIVQNESMLVLKKFEAIDYAD